MTYTISDILSFLHMQELSRVTARRKLNDLIVRHGFPRPLPGTRVWSKLLVDSWIAAGGVVAAAPVQDDYIAAARRRIEDGIRARQRHPAA
ncbi:MAG: hypothetical protein LCH61_19130 [Proteobacteria bacterium]|nr:hypothetical protein [Pseudomonadota bacterium]